jgi:Tfp pilus assembly protein PilF
LRIDQSGQTTMMSHARIALVAAALLAAAAVPVAANMRGDEGSDSTGADPNVAAGRQAIEAKDYAGAVRALEQAAAADPRNADVQTWLGFAHRSLGHYDLAFKYYREALALSPGHRGARCSSAWARSPTCR